MGLIMKSILKIIRNKCHSDLINILNKLTDKIENEGKQYDYLNKKLEENMVSLLDQKDIIIELMQEINQLKYEFSTIKTTVGDVSKVTYDVKDKLYRNDWEPKQNIKQYLQQVAGIQTAEYIIKNMPTVPSFNVTLDILTYGLSNVSIDGLYLEFGVFSGRTINHIAKKSKDKIIYGFDSFDGLPEDWRTGFEEGTFKRDELPKVRDNVKLIKGWFNETLPDFILQHNQKCAFIHIDCDLYSSTKCVFDLLKDKIVHGTIIVFDEYFNYPDWKNGEYKALQEFMQETNLSYEYIGYVEIMEQVAIRII